VIYIDQALAFPMHDDVHLLVSGDQLRSHPAHEYFGYESRLHVYRDRIKALNQTNNPRGMITEFVNSAEYRQRFGP
jgi:hypothetical protein